MECEGCGQDTDQECFCEGCREEIAVDLSGLLPLQEPEPLPAYSAWQLDMDGGVHQHRGERVLEKQAALFDPERYERPQQIPGQTSIVMCDGT